MSWLRKPVGLAATVAVHMALFVWAGSLARDELRKDTVELVEVELVELGVARAAPLALRAGDEGEDVPHVAPLPPAPAVKSPPRKPRPAPTVQQEAEPIGREPVEPIEREPVEVEAAPPAPEPVVPVAVSSPAPTGDTAEAAVVAERPAAGRSTGVRGSSDFSSYGAKIVEIVLDELDRDPVRGIRRKDTIQLLLEVEPNGDLAWRGDGRFGFARVLRSSLGRLRTRQVLRRIERASYRFPRHPSGFKRRHYIVDVTVNFRDLG